MNSTIIFPCLLYKRLLPIAVFLLGILLPLKGQANPQIAPPSLEAYLYTSFDVRSFGVRTNIRAYPEGFRFFFDIALDSAFTNIVPGWNNRELSTTENPLIGNAERFLFWSIIPNATYYITEVTQRCLDQDSKRLVKELVD